jgi:hypothetical protein
MEPTERADKSPERAAFESLAGKEKLAALVEITRALASSAAEARRTDWQNEAKVKELTAESKLEEKDGVTPFGNAITVLTRGPEDASERALCAALYAHVLAETKLNAEADEDRAASDMLWLASHTPFDATALVDRALGDGAPEFLAAVYGRAERAQKRAQDGNAELLAACLTILASEKAAPFAAKLRAICTHPGLVKMLTRSEVETTTRLEGEMVAPLRGPVATTLLAITGIMFVMEIARAFGKLALAYKRPAEATFAAGTIRIKTKTELLGRTLREREYFFTKQSLRRAVREVRYPRLAFYSGLFALAIGSYVGVSLFVDGVRSASPSLLGVGVLVIAIGVGLEYAFVTLLPGKKKRCRVAFESHSGPRLCIGDVDIQRADRALDVLKG